MTPSMPQRLVVQPPDGLLNGLGINPEPAADGGVAHAEQPQLGGRAGDLLVDRGRGGVRDGDLQGDSPDGSTSLLVEAASRWTAPAPRAAGQAFDRPPGFVNRCACPGFHPGKCSCSRGGISMKKIPTVFERHERAQVFDQVRVGCEWVFAGEGVATEKLDGTNVRLTIRSGTLVRVEKRRNPNREQKKLGIIDGWYVDGNEASPEDQWIFEAVRSTDVGRWPDGEHPTEALGPRIQGNPLGLEQHVCVPFELDIPTFDEVERTFEGLRAFLAEADSKFSPGHPIEGLVFHHADGRRAKIKRRDFSG